MWIQTNILSNVYQYPILIQIILIQVFLYAVLLEYTNLNRSVTSSSIHLWLHYNSACHNRHIRNLNMCSGYRLILSLIHEYLKLSRWACQEPASTSFQMFEVVNSSYEVLISPFSLVVYKPCSMCFQKSV